MATVEVDPLTGFVKILRYVVAEDCGQMIKPGDRRGAGSRRRRPGDRRRPIRGERLRRRRQPARRHTARLSDPHRGGRTGDRVHPPRVPGRPTTDS